MAASATTDILSADVLTLGAMLAIFRRRRTIFLRVFCAILALGCLYCLVATRRYRATSEVQVEKEDSGAFGLENSVMGPDGSGSPTDSLDYNTTLQTQVSILKSEALALAVIRDVKLEDTDDYFGRHSPQLIRVPSWLLFWRRPVEPLSVPLEQAPDRRYVTLKIFASHLKVEPVTGTRLIDVSYSDPDPARAAAVVNRLVGLAADFTFKQRFDSTLRASSWLSGQISDLKRQTQMLQARAAALQRDTGMFGNDASRNVVLERLDSLNQTLSAAEQNRILKEAVYRVAKGGDPELISSLSGNASMGAASSPINNSLSLIQTLRQQEAALRSQLAQDSVRYGPAYPQLEELEAQLHGVERSITEEVHRLGERARTDYEIAARSEAGARSAFDAQKKEAGRLNDTVVAYGLAKQEADSSRELYEGLLAKLKQAGVLQGLRSSNITIVNVAQVPPPSHPKSPNIPLILAAALAVGSFLAGTAIVLRELTDNKVRSPEGLERILGVPLLAVLPAVAGAHRARPRGLWQLGPTGDAPFVSLPKRPPSLPALDGGTSTFAEGLRSLRTALLLSRSGRPPQVILITSCLQGEGKTTLALNLAALFAQQGSRVLLVDADLRKPTLHTLIAPATDDRCQGLSQLLAGRGPASVVHPIASLPTFAMVCGEEVAPFPSELLGSARMKGLLRDWRKEYDFILLDSAPVLPVTDSVLLSQFSDATLMIARYGVTTKQALRRGLETLHSPHPSGQAPIGTVLNAVARDSGDFYEYFGYQGESYAYTHASA